LHTPLLEQLAPTTRWQASGGVVQSETSQQAALGMQLFEAAQTLLPTAQPQPPPGPEQLWPSTVQSPLVPPALRHYQRRISVIDCNV